MKTAHFYLVASAFLSVLCLPPRVFPQGTAFLYQGRLNAGGSPANGTYDLEFTVYDAVANGNVVGGPWTNSAAAVTNGIFQAQIDFGAGVFNGGARWLEVAARTNGGGTFSTLSPRQPVLSAPYAIQSAGANVASSANSVLAGHISGALSVSQLPGAVVTNGASGVNISGTFSGSGAGVTNVNLLGTATGGVLSFTTNYGNFGAGSTANVGSGPYMVVTADVNGDGKVDLISVNRSSSTLTVLTNNGSGGFSFSSSPPAGNFPQFGAAADINGDGKVDLIIATIGANSLTLLTNNGNGGFAVASSPAVGSEPYCVTAADVNGDGKIDLISANYNDSTLTILTNNGSGGFAVASSPAVGTHPVYVLAADVNGDGKVDLISANSGTGTLTILTNNGSGGFNVSSSPAVGASPFAMQLADIYGNGKMDLIVSSQNSDVFIVMTNDGSGGFSVASTFSAGFTPGYFTVADVNGDGKLDLIAPYSLGYNVVVLTNNGVGGFAMAFTLGLGTGSYPEFVAAADVNGDGIMDLVSANFGINTLTIFTNAASYTASFTGNGSGLTSLSAANISTGTISPALLPGVVVTNNASGLTLGGTFSGNGQGLASLNASNISSGTLPDSRLSANVPLLNASQNFTGQNTFSGNVGIGIAASAAIGLHVSNSVSYHTMEVDSGSTGGTWLTLNNAGGGGRIWDIIATGNGNAEGPGQLLFHDANAGERMIITTNGYVGIGTATPETSLHVAGVSGTAIRVTGPGGGGTTVSYDLSTYDEGSNPPAARILGTDNDYSDDLDLMTKIQGNVTNALVSRIHIASANGNVGIGNSSPGNLLTVGTGGAYCNGTTWVNGSDRNSKTGFAAVDPAEVLAKISALPITEWQYKTEPDGVKHMGPMAQDFYAAFGLNGADDKHISTVDEGGVALAAIQALNRKLEAENAALKQQNSSITQRLEHLEEDIRDLQRRK